MRAVDVADRGATSPTNRTISMRTVDLANRIATSSTNRTISVQTVDVVDPSPVDHDGPHERRT